MASAFAPTVPDEPFRLCAARANAEASLHERIIDSGKQRHRLRQILIDERHHERIGGALRTRVPELIEYCRVDGAHRGGVWSRRGTTPPLEHGAQLRHFEWLRDVIIHACEKAFFPIALHRVGCHRDDRHAC